MKKSAVVFALVIVALVTALPSLAAEYSQSDAAIAWLRQAQEPDGGFSSGFSEGSDFGSTAEVILAGVAAGQDVSMWVSAEGNSPLDYVVSQIAGGTIEDTCNLSKAILVAVATGQDPRDLAGKDLIAQLITQQSPDSGRFGDTLFKHAYAVVALHSAGVPVPASAATAMTSTFTEDGAWSLFGDTAPATADTNTTALVMQALVAVGERDAAAGALPYLRRMQNEDGGFPYQKPSAWGTDSDANSTAVVLQALAALDESLGNWVVNGTDPLGALLALWDAESGAYYWQAGVPFANMLATAQAVQAAEGMTFAALPKVGASNAPQVTAVATDVTTSTPLLPASGAHWPVATEVVMGGILLLVGLSALLRRK